MKLIIHYNIRPDCEEMVFEAPFSPYNYDRPAMLRQIRQFVEDNNLDDKDLGFTITKALIIREDSDEGTEFDKLDISLINKAIQGYLCGFLDGVRGLYKLYD